MGGEPSAVAVVASMAEAEAEVVTEGDARLPVGPLVEATVKYASYLEHKAAVDSLYKRFSKSRDGQLTPAELRDALESVERKAGVRDVFGICFQVIPSAKDVDQVIRLCDIDQDGYINKIEIISALKAWRKLAEHHAKMQTQVCSIM